MKNALLEELSNGRFRLLQSENPQVPVSKIEFNNRKAARNWARSRGFVVDFEGEQPSFFHGAN